MSTVVEIILGVVTIGGVPVLCWRDPAGLATAHAKKRRDEHLRSLMAPYSHAG